MAQNILHSNHVAFDRFKIQSAQDPRKKTNLQQRILTGLLLRKLRLHFRHFVVAGSIVELRQGKIFHHIVRS